MLAESPIPLIRPTSLSHASSFILIRGWNRGKGSAALRFPRKPNSGPFLLPHSYKEEGCHTASRSGHCAALLPVPGQRPGHQLLLFGGCKSAEPEVAGRWSAGQITVLITFSHLASGGRDNSAPMPWTVPPFSPKEEPPAAPRLTQQLAKLVSSGQGSRQGPAGLRHHSCSVVGPFAVLFGGETLTRARDTICNDLYIYDARERQLMVEEGMVGRWENLKPEKEGKVVGQGELVGRLKEYTEY